MSGAILVPVSQVRPEKNEIIVHVLKVWGNWLGYPISFSTPSWPSPWADLLPGLLELFLAGSSKNAPSHLAGSTKMPLFKKYPKKSKYENFHAMQFFSMLVGEFLMWRRRIYFML